MVVEFKWDDVIIGSTLAAVIHAHKRGLPILFNRSPCFFKFKKLPSQEYECEVWQSIASKLALRGLNPFGDKVSFLRINPETIEVICHNRKYVIYYKNIKFFDDENIENFPFKAIDIKNYHVSDWFRVTSGTKHDHWFLDDNSEFVKKIYFFTKITLPKYKDCVAESFIDPARLNDVEYTSTMARLKTIAMMKDAGILGTKHTRTFRYPIKMELIERQVFKIKEEVLEEKDNYILDTREFN